MKEIEPTAIVAKAEREVESIISSIAKKIGAPYKAATLARRKANACMLEIGRTIIEACRLPEVQKAVQRANTKECKPNGGTATRVHSWVADQLAARMGYNPEYLREAARQYLEALNASLNRAQQPGCEWNTKTGILSIPVETKELPVLEIKPPLKEREDHPKAEKIFKTPSDGTETPDPPPEQHGEDLARKLARDAELDGALKPELVTGLARGLSPIFEAHGYAIVKRDRNSKENQK